MSDLLSVRGPSRLDGRYMALSLHPPHAVTRGFLHVAVLVPREAHPQTVQGFVVDCLQPTTWWLAVQGNLQFVCQDVQGTDHLQRLQLYTVLALPQNEVLVHDELQRSRLVGVNPLDEPLDTATNIRSQQ